MLSALSGSPEKKSVSPRCASVSREPEAEGVGRVHDTDMFEILQEIGYSLALAVGEDGLVEAVAGFAWATLASRPVTAWRRDCSTSAAR